MSREAEARNGKEKTQPNESTGNDVKLTVNQNQEDEMEIEGYKVDRVRSTVVLISYFLTAGLLRLIFYWRPDWMLVCTHLPCRLRDAEKVLLKDQYKQNFVEDVVLTTVDGMRVRLRSPRTRLFYKKKPEHQFIEDAMSSPGYLSPYLLKSFTNKKLKYLWSDAMDTFVKQGGLEYDVSYYTGVKANRLLTATCNFFHRLKPLAEADVRKLRAFYGLNSIPIHVKPVIILTLEQVFNPFYIFQLFSVILWFTENYIYYAICIVVISVSSISFTVYSTRKMHRALKSTVKGYSSVNIFREEGLVNSRYELLVPGDIIEIPRQGCSMSCDAVLLNGTCIVNESMLTGESVPITKTSLSPTSFEEVKFDIKDHGRHVLFCGTKVIQTRYYQDQSVKAVVIRTGFLTAKGDLVRSIMFPKPVDFQFYQDTYKFVGFLAGCAFIGMVYTIVIMVQRGSEPGEIALRTLDLITIAVPPALPAAIAVGSVMAQARLKAKDIFCIQPSSINIAGSVNTVCFDKTGTLTEDGLDIWGIVPLQGTSFSEPCVDANLIAGSKLLCAMATCHSLTIINGELGGDPLDIKMFEATSWELEEPGEDSSRYDMIMPTVVRPKKDAQAAYTHSGPEIGIIRQFTFSSSLQRMSVITRELNGPSFDIYVKGSPEMVASLSLPETVPANFFEVMSGFTARGYRVIALAYRPLLINYNKALRVERQDVEKDLQFLGLLVMENKLKPETASVISELNFAKIRTVMVTGDNMLTALSVARECGLVPAQQRIVLVSALPPAGKAPALLEYHYTSRVEDVGACSNAMTASLPELPGGDFCFAVTGKSWSVLRRHFPEVLERVVVRGAVFARMGPDQKAQLVEALQQAGYYVGMCGDGANDCGALKAAHAGISLSPEEASVASPFTSTKPNISCVPRLIKEGRAALVTSFGIFKFIACYSLNQFVSTLILYWIGSNLTDFEFLYEDFLLISTFTITFGRTPACSELHVKPPLVKLTSFQPVFCLLLMTAVSAALQVFGYYWVQWQPWFEFHDIENGDYSCHQNTVIFYFAMFQLIGLVIMYSRGPPYRKSIIRNISFLINVSLALALSMWIIIYPLPFMTNVLLLKLIPAFEYRAAILAIGIATLFLFVVLDVCLLEAMYFRRCLKYCKHHVCKCHAQKKAYVVVEKEYAKRGHQLLVSDSEQIADVLQREASFSDLPPLPKSEDRAPLLDEEEGPSLEQIQRHHLHADRHGQTSLAVEANENPAFSDETVYKVVNEKNTLDNTFL